MATNPVASLPNADAVRAALKGCELSIVSEAVRASDTVDACRIRLPALAWAEKDGTVTNSERGISRQRPFLPPPGEARQDWWIIAEVAQAPGLRRGLRLARAPPTSSASMQPFRPSRTTARATSTSAPVPIIDDRGYATLAPFVWPSRRATRRAAAASSPRAASSIPTGARASSRSCRVRRCTAPTANGRCGSTPAACATSGTP